MFYLPALIIILAGFSCATWGRGNAVVGMIVPFVIRLCPPNALRGKYPVLKMVKQSQGMSILEKGQCKVWKWLLLIVMENHEEKQ